MFALKLDQNALCLVISEKVYVKSTKDRSLKTICFLTKSSLAELGFLFYNDVVTKKNSLFLLILRDEKISFAYSRNFKDNNSKTFQGLYFS